MSRILLLGILLPAAINLNAPGSIVSPPENSTFLLDEIGGDAILHNDDLGAVGVTVDDPTGQTSIRIQLVKICSSSFFDDSGHISNSIGQTQADFHPQLILSDGLHVI